MSLVTIYDADAKTKKSKEYTLQDLRELRIEEVQLEERLTQIRLNKEEAEKQLENKLNKYFTGFYEIKFDEPTNCEVTADTFNLYRLELLKEEMNLKDVKVETIFNKISITLIW